MPRMSRKKLTQRMVDAIKPGTKEAWLMDSDVIGLGVRIRPNAKPTYVLRWVDPRGRTKKLTICYASVPLVDARNIASQRLGEIAKGNDPAEAKRKERHSTSVNELFERVVEEITTQGRAATYLRDWNQQVRDYINPLLGHMSVYEVTSSDIDRLLSRLRRRSALHNRVRSVLNKGFNLAVR